MLTLTITIVHYTGVFNQCHEARGKKGKSIKTGKEDTKLLYSQKAYLCTYKTQNKRKLTDKLLQLIHIFSKVAGYKIIIPEPTVFLKS